MTYLKLKEYSEIDFEYLETLGFTTLRSRKFNESNEKVAVFNILKDEKIRKYFVKIYKQKNYHDIIISRFYKVHEIVMDKPILFTDTKKIYDYIVNGRTAEGVSVKKYKEPIETAIVSIKNKDEMKENKKTSVKIKEEKNVNRKIKRKK